MVPNMGPVENGHKKKADGTAKPAMLPLTLAPLGQIPHLKSREKNASPSFLLPLSCFPFFWGGTSSIVFILLKDPPLKPTCFSLRRVAIVELWVCVSFFSVAWQDMQDIGSSHGS